MSIQLTWRFAGILAAALLAAASGAAAAEPIRLDSDSIRFVWADADAALPSPGCNFVNGANACVFFRCQAGGSQTCGLPDPLSDTQDVLIQFDFQESQLEDLAGTSNCVVRDLNLGLEVDHTYVGDVQAWVQAEEAGSARRLLASQPGCNSDDIELVFDEQAGPSAPTCNGTSPSYRNATKPSQSLTPLLGGQLASTTGDDSRIWAYLAEDVASGDSGQVQQMWFAWGVQCTDDGGGGGGGGTGDCVPNATTLCLDDQAGDKRFKVQGTYQTSQGGGFSGPAHAIQTNGLGVTKGGLLWYFDAANPEVLVKVLNGCGINDRFWVYMAATTNVGFVVTITDTQTGVFRNYQNTDGVVAAPVQDVNGLDCTP
jgi:hypothetical protein